MNKIVIGAMALIVVTGAGFYFISPRGAALDEGAAVALAGAERVAPGTYTVDPTQSEFRWAAKKPLIEGYVNSGTISLSEGAITVAEATATGSFTLDMNTLQVGLTAKKPGQEGALTGHLKGERFFDVATHPTATFAITRVEPLNEAEYRYTVTGNLTMKGATNEISIPATIYTKDGVLHAAAETEIDRTKWGITVGSGNFFENLGDNPIDDMVALSFELTATSAQ